MRVSSKGQWWSLGEQPRAKAVELDADSSMPWHPRFIDYVDHLACCVRCYKCAAPIQTLIPALYKPHGSKSDSAAQPMHSPQGERMVRMAPTPTFRMGFYRYRKLIDNQEVLGRFEFLHCADCHPQHDDGESLLACLLAGLHDELDHIVARLTLGANEDLDRARRAQMAHFDDIELIGLDGSSMGPLDLAVGNQGG